MVEWSEEVAHADWIGPRLAPFMSGQVTSVVPGGFEAYARLLHPAEIDDRRVRWREVAALTGVPVRPEVCFPELALTPAGGAELVGLRGPDEGTPAVEDVRALVEVLARHTQAPEDCWFCVWDGFGDHVLPVDARVELPHRDHAVYRGAVAAALDLVTDPPLPRWRPPNLWWPADRAWCVASEIDLEWTYVGGSRALVDALVADDRVEALQVAGDSTYWLDLPAWLRSAVDDAVDAVLAGGEGVVSTNLGTTLTTLRPGGRLRRGEVHTERSRSDGRGESSSTSYLHGREKRDVRGAVEFQVEHAVLDLIR